MADNEYILEMNHISKKFPGVQALSDVSFNLKKGEVHCLLGENGAGKSTLIKILSGFNKLDEGQILLDGQPVNIQTPHDAIELGISTIYQETSLIPTMTVVENIFLGDELYVNNNDKLILDLPAMHKRAQEILESINVKMNVNKKVRELTAAEQQMVEIAKSLVNQHKIIIMDEPTSSLSGKDTEELFRIIAELQAKGVSFIYISHRMQELFRISDRVTILRDGKYIGTVNTKDASEPMLIEMMVGRKLEEYRKAKSAATDKVVLEVRNLKRNVGNKVHDISFKAYEGEILGFAGLVGSGRTEAMRCLYGYDKDATGYVCINGKEIDLKKHSPHNSVKHGFSYLSEDRKREGLVLMHSVCWNLTLANLSKVLGRRRLLDLKKEAETARGLVDELSIATPGIQQLTQFLSGGNQQKVVVGKWLLTDCSVLVFDEPTRGIDVGAKTEIYNIMRRLTEEGKTVLMVSSDLPELLRVCDRIVVVNEGCVTGEVVNEEGTTQEEIMKYMLERKDQSA